MGTSGKRFILLLAVALLIMTGLGTTLMAQATGALAPDATGLVSSASVLDVPVPGVQAASVAGAAAAPAAGQLDVLTWQLDEAWRKSDWNRCIDVLNAILAVDVANVEARERLFQARVNFGWLHLSNQRFDEAYKQFALALQVKPDGQEAKEGLRLLQQLIVCTPTVCPLALVCTPTPCPPICPPVCPTLCPPVCIPASPTPCPPVCPTVCPPACVPVCPTVCPPACVPACPTMCPGAVRVYIVQRGDNLFRIALRFSTSVALIMKANCLQTTTIKAGQTLIIP